MRRKYYFFIFSEKLLDWFSAHIFSSRNFQAKKILQMPCQLHCSCMSCAPYHLGRQLMKQPMIQLILTSSSNFLQLKGATIILAFSLSFPLKEIKHCKIFLQRKFHQHVLLHMLPVGIWLTHDNHHCQTNHFLLKPQYLFFVTNFFSTYFQLSFDWWLTSMTT